MSSTATNLPGRLFPPSQPTAHPRRRAPISAHASPTSTPTPTAAPPPLTTGDGGGRLEPRVERREGGYWVLKEKYRAGINPQEKVKLERDPMKLVIEDGIRELATKPLEEVEGSKAGKDDIDVRLKWLGLFHRRKHHYGRFMMRLKLPNGVTTSEQVRYLASIIDGYGKEGCADVTTRSSNLRIVISEVEKKTRTQFKGLFDKKPGEIAEVGTDSGEGQKLDEQNQKDEAVNSESEESRDGDEPEPVPGANQIGLFALLWPSGRRILTSFGLHKCSIL